MAIAGVLACSGCGAGHTLSVNRFAALTAQETQSDPTDLVSVPDEVSGDTTPRVSGQNANTSPSQVHTPASRASGSAVGKTKVSGFVYPLERSHNQFEVLGIGRLSDSAVDCWNTQGQTDQLLTRLLQEALSKRSANPIRQIAGRKNRFMIVKQTQWFATQSEPVVIKAVGSNPGHFDVISLEERTDGKPGTPDYHYTMIRAIPFDVELEETSVSLLLRRTGTLSPQPEMEFRPGATTAIGERTFRLKRVEEGVVKAEIPSFTKKEGKWWTVTFESVQPEDDIAEYYVQPLGKDGKVLGYVDDIGAPVSAKTVHDERMRLYREKRGKIGPVEFQGGFRRAAEKYGHYQPLANARYLFAVDPKFVSRLKLSAFVHRDFELSPVPLDPMRP